MPTTEVSNVKFCPGNKRRVSAEALAEQLRRADAAVAAGVAVRTTSLDAGMPITVLLGGESSP